MYNKKEQTVLTKLIPKHPHHHTTLLFHFPVRQQRYIKDNKNKIGLEKRVITYTVSEFRKCLVHWFEDIEITTVRFLSNYFFSVLFT